MMLVRKYYWVSLFLSIILATTFVGLSMAAGEESLYKILGVSNSASTKEIKKAYRRLALATHPDKRKDIPKEQAAAEFHRVVQAFETLSDENSRRSYDRTGRTQQQQQQGNSGGGSGFDWSFQRGRNAGGRRQHRYEYRSDRRYALKDEFIVKEAMSRVMSIVSFSQLETVMLDDDGLLERNLLMVFVTPGDVETLVDDEIVFPYPFAGMSEQGIWWEDLLQTAKVRFHKMNDLTRFFNLPVGDQMRRSNTPTFLFGRRGQPLSADFARLQTRNRDDFTKWVWQQIEVKVNFVNQHPHPVELYWLHGRHAHDKGVLQPGESKSVVTMLTHEWWIRDYRVDRRPDSPGRHTLTKESMVAIWKIKTDEPERDLVIPPKSCIDTSGHCPWWKGSNIAQGECKKNPVFMENVCPLT